MTTTRFATITALACIAVGGCGAVSSSGAVDVVASERSPVETTAARVTTTLAFVAPIAADQPRPVPADMLVQPATPHPSSVAVVGDSLTLSANDEIEFALAVSGFDIVAIDGLESRRMARGSSELPPGVDAVEAIRATSEPDLWVIALGTNDVASANLDEFRASMDEVLTAVPTGAPVIWVDLWIRDREESIDDANQLIRTRLERWSGGAAVVDWHAHGEAPGVITGDGVHLTESGRRLFAASIVSGINDLFAGRPATPRSTSAPSATAER